MSSAARTPDDIAADIAATRNRLAGTIDQLVYRAHPKTIVSRQLDSIRASFVNTDGSPRVDKIAKVAGIGVGIVATIVVLRRVVG